MQIKAFHFVVGTCSILILKCIAFYAVGFFGLFAFIFFNLYFLNFLITLVIAKARLFVMVWARYSAIRCYAGLPKEL